MIFGVAGSRFWGFSPQNFQLESLVFEVLESLGDVEGIVTGGALGVDQRAMFFAVDEGIPLTVVLPFPPKIFTARWKSGDRAHFEWLLEQSTRVSVVSPSFSWRAYHLRNARVVELADECLAFFPAGRVTRGTLSFCKLAEAAGKPLRVFSPGGDSR